MQPSWIIGALVVLFVGAPFLPSGALLLLDTLAARVLAVGVLLWLAWTEQPKWAIVALLVIGALYLERNRRKIQRVQERYLAPDGGPPLTTQTVEEEAIPQTTVPVLPFAEPDAADYMDYLPTKSMQSDAFAPVAPTMNQKLPLPTIPVGAAGAGLYIKGGFVSP